MSGSNPSSLSLEIIHDEERHKKLLAMARELLDRKEKVEKTAALSGA
jgi:hypothetical protein